MSIVCGTDFSEMAAHAATAAACWAARAGKPVHLVHALDVWPEELRERPGHPLLLWAESRLEREAERLRALGAEVQVHALAGTPDVVLRDVAHEQSASALVVGAVGNRRNPSHQLGSRADRTARTMHLPVLAIRDSSAFVAWAKEGRPLKVVMGIDDSMSVDAAARWLDELCRSGPVELTLAHLYWPPEAMHRLGLEGLRSFVDADPELVKTLESQFSQRLDGLLHAKIRTYRIEPHLGRLGDGLAALAAEEHADLLVVGSRGRSLVERFWQGSVARQALHAAAISVACVPTPAASAATVIPRLKSVLVATDFSELGNGAVPLAFAAASPGATVHLLHVIQGERPRIDPYDIFHPVVSETTSEALKAAETRLLALVPSEASSKGITTRVHAVDASDAWEAICQAGERFSVDVVCLGTHGRTGIPKAALGSVAARVLAHSRRPLLLARGPNP
ncbi:MAG TPA: universal stress protein [Polyangiaceae bacterium]|nr:universal stress protein [Polyangiaceae bacterium]